MTTTVTPLHSYSKGECGLLPEQRNNRVKVVASITYFSNFHIQNCRFGAGGQKEIIIIIIILVVIVAYIHQSHH